MHFLSFIHKKLVNNQIQNLIRKRITHKCRYFCSDNKAAEVDVQLLNGYVEQEPLVQFLLFITAHY